MASAPATSSHRAVARPSGRAWGVLILLTFVYVVNFLDRQLLSILAKPIQDTLHITDGQLGLIGGLYFAFFYGFIALPVGWLVSYVERRWLIATGALSTDEK